MQAGRLDERVVIRRQTWRDSEFGSQKIEEWADHIRTRAAVSYESGARTTDGGEIFFAEQVLFEIRIYHDVRDLDRISWRGGEYRILAIEIDRKLQRQKIRTELVNE